MPDDSDRIEKAFEIRERYLRRVRENRTAADRLVAFAQLQQVSFEMLRASPDGYRRFLERNMRLRRVEVTDGKWRPVSPVRRAQLP